MEKSRLAKAVARKTVKMGSRVGEAMIWSYGNPRKAMLAYGVLVAGVFAIAFALRPDRAEAIAPIVVIGGIAASIIGGGAIASTALGDATDKIEDAVRSLVEILMNAAGAVAHTGWDGALINAAFDELLGQGDFAGTIEHIHNAVAIPVAQVVMAVVFVVALVKIVGKISANEGGIDTWQLVWLFVMYGIASALIMGSWEIMQFAFGISKAAIAATFQGYQGEDYTAFTVSDDIQNLGALLFMVIAALVIGGVTTVVVLASQLVVIARALQIYIYTAFAPIPLAFMMSDGGRQVTISFVKKYVAVLLSGVILALLYVLYTMSIKSFGMSVIQVKDAADLLTWFVGYMFQVGVYAAFCWAFFQTGSWARDIVGA